MTVESAREPEMRKSGGALRASGALADEVTKFLGLPRGLRFLFDPDCMDLSSRCSVFGIGKV